MSNPKKQIASKACSRIAGPTASARADQPVTAGARKFLSVALSLVLATVSSQIVNG